MNMCDAQQAEPWRPLSSPQVSVVMPVWNGARYIGRAIESVLSQTLTYLELVIIDDGSTDDTRSVIEAYADPRVRLLCNERNRGPAFSRNRGVCAARGEWIALLDADDWFSPARLETLCARAALQGADAIADDLYIIDEGRSRPRSTLFTETSCRFEDGACLGVADMLAHEIGALKPVFRRALFTQHGHRYDENLRYGEDFLLYLSWLVMDARLLVTRDAHYYLRRGDTGSLTTSRLAMVQSAVELNRRLLNDARLHRKPHACRALSKRVSATRDLLVFYEVVCPLRARQFRAACAAFARSPRFLPVALRRLPKIIGLRLRRLAYQWRQLAAPRKRADLPAAGQES